MSVDEGAPCIGCGRTDLPLHTDWQCPDCHDLDASTEPRFDPLDYDGLFAALAATIDLPEQCPQCGGTAFGDPFTEDIWVLRECVECSHEVPVV